MQTLNIVNNISWWNNFKDQLAHVNRLYTYLDKPDNGHTKEF